MSARILVVDDTPLNVKLLTARLGREYYTVLTATNGLEALEVAQKEKPDLVLLDVMMPEMDGFETCRRMKEVPELRHIPVVMVTALTDVEDRVSGLTAGADDFLSKPINDDILLARVRSLLRTKILMDEWRLREQTAVTLNPDVAAMAHNPPPKILVISDDSLDAALIAETAKAKNMQVDVAKTASRIEGKDYDVIIVDLQQSDGDPLKLCSALRSKDDLRHTPIMTLANSHIMDKVCRSLDLGVNDCIIRPLDASEILARLNTQILHKRAYDGLRKNYASSLSLALTDPLTEAYNRRYLEIHLPEMLKRAAQQNKPMGLLVLDIDHFKKINDTYGHPAGDSILREFVQRVQLCLRANDFVARLGGEEFVVALPDAYTDAASAIAERLRARIEKSPFLFERKQVKVTVSIGCAVLNPQEPETMAEILSRADKAVYAAKHTGRNCVVMDGDAA